MSNHKKTFNFDSRLFKVLVGCSVALLVCILCIVSIKNAGKKTYTQPSQIYSLGMFTIYGETEILEGVSMKKVFAKRKKDGKLFPFVVGISYNVPKDGTEVELVNVNLSTRNFEPGYFRFCAIKTSSTDEEDLKKSSAEKSPPNPMF
jgi:hypothetical protein